MPEFNKPCICVWCDELFYASRYNAKYCSSACRVKAHRAKNSHAKKLAAIKESILALLDDIPTAEGHEQTLQELETFVSARHYPTIG